MPCLLKYVHTHTHTHIHTGSPEELKTLADAMFLEMDKNKDGHVTFKEYFAVVSRENPETTEKNEQVCLYVCVCAYIYIYIYMHKHVEILGTKAIKGSTYHSQHIHTYICKYI